jgi:hypothetical protein
MVCDGSLVVSRGHHSIARLGEELGEAVDLTHESGHQSLYGCVSVRVCEWERKSGGVVPGWVVSQPVSSVEVSE